MTEIITNLWQTKDDLKHELWSAVKPEYRVYNAIPIYDGMKITMKHHELDRLLTEIEFLKTYSITIKRLNRWYYSVYFKEIK